MGAVNDSIPESAGHVVVGHGDDVVGIRDCRTGGVHRSAQRAIAIRIGRRDLQNEDELEEIEKDAYMNECCIEFDGLLSEEQRHFLQETRVVVSNS